MRLLIISHTPHYQMDGLYYGWGSTIKEIDQLATLFEEVVHLAPLHSLPVPASSLTYTNPKIQFLPVKPAGGESFLNKLTIVREIPNWLRLIKRKIQQADIIHIRCPAAIGLVALISVWIWGKGKPCWVKYAGNWQPDQKEPFSYKLQRFLLVRNIHKGIVSVNGSWPNQKEHIISFFNPSYSTEEYLLFKRIAEDKQLSKPIQLLFVGRIEYSKGVGRVIKILSDFREVEQDFFLYFIGDGIEKPYFESLAKNEGLNQYVKFIGWKNKNEINDYYKKAHFILLPSTASEGWPKVLSEAMAFGVIPLASTVSSIPQLIDKFKSGHAISAEDPNAYIAALLHYLKNPHIWKIDSLNCVQAANYFTYENYLDAIKKKFYKLWKIKLENV